MTNPRSITPSRLIAVLCLALGCSDNANHMLTGNPDGGGGATGGGGAAGASGATGTGGAAGAGGATGGGGGTGFVANRGCQSGGDCTNGATCARFGANGPGACVTPTAQVTSCTGNNPRNQCCATSDCAAKSGGLCFTITSQPVQCSSTAGVDVYNTCVTDGCASDTDCTTGQLCTPAGFGLGHTCIAADCRSDADCTAEAGGACVLLELGCCTPQIGGNTFRKTQLACTYPSNGCQKDADCPGGFCTISDGRARCSTTCR